MHKYSMFIQWSDVDQCYIVSIPDLPGCMSDGKTPSEAIENAQIVIDEWIETAQMMNKPIPSPTIYTPI